MLKKACDSLHVALVTPMSGRIGGLEKFARFVTAAVLDAGGQVTVALSGQDVFEHPARGSGRLTIEPVDWLDDTLAGDREYRWAGIWKRRGWFRRIRPDVALFVQSSNTPYRASVAAARLAGIPVVLTHRTMPYVIPHVPRRRHLLGLVPGMGLHRRKLVVKGWLPGALANRIVYNSHAVRRGYEHDYRYPRGKGAVIVNAVSCDKGTVPIFEAPGCAESCRDGQSPRPLRIGYVGRLSREKLIEVLFQAFACLTASRPVRLVLHGHGPEEAGLRAFAERLGIADRVEWPGPTTDPAAAHRDLDIVVLCSPRESSSNMVLEAMAAGKAVIVTNAGGLPELVEDGRCGLIVKARSVPQLSSALQRLIDDDALRRALGVSGSKAALYRHDPGRVAAAWVNLLRSLVRRHPVTQSVWRTRAQAGLEGRSRSPSAILRACGEPITATISHSEESTP